MKRNRPNKVQISFARWFGIYLSLLLLLVPLRWLFAAAVGAAVHELFHIAAIRLMGLRIHSVRIGISGAKIHTQPMTDIQELLCALAGPFGGLSLLLFSRWIPMICLCSAFQSLYNLLPIYPADGGRALRCGAKLLFSEVLARKITDSVELAAIIGVAVLGTYGTFHLRLGLLPLLIAAAIIFGAIKNK